MNSFDRIVLSIIGLLILVIAAIVAAGDRVGATVLSISPANGETAPVSATIEVKFSQPMNPGEVRARFSVSPKVDGTITWDNTTLIFTPKVLLTPGVSYVVEIGEGASANTGRKMLSPFRSEFVVRNPSVLFVAPADSQKRGIVVTTVEVKTSQVIYSPDYGIFDYEVSADGRQIAVTAYDENGFSDIWIMSSDGTNVRRATSCAPDFCGSASWSKDGTKLAYERSPSSLQSGGMAPSRIWILEKKTGETYPLFDDKSMTGYGPMFSPDGRKLALFDINGQGIRIVNMQDGSSIVLPSQMGEVGSFSPDSESLVYPDIRPVGGQFFAELWKASLGKTKSLAPLISSAEEDQTPKWSPNGKWIAFARRALDRQGGFALQLYLANSQTGDIRQLTDDPEYNNTGFVWSPTGESILVQRFQLAAGTTTPEIWLYNLKDESIKLIARNALNPQWLP